MPYHLATPHRKGLTLVFFSEREGFFVFFMSFLACAFHQSVFFASYRSILFFFYCLVSGGRIRTYNLQIMSLTRKPFLYSAKGVNPAAGSPTATLLRLRSSYQTVFGQPILSRFTEQRFVGTLPSEKARGIDRLPTHSTSGA